MVNSYHRLQKGGLFGNSWDETTKTLTIDKHTHMKANGGQQLQLSKEKEFEKMKTIKKMAEYAGFYVLSGDSGDAKDVCFCMYNLVWSMYSFKKR